MILLGIPNPYSWIMPNRPISSDGTLSHDLHETSTEAARYRYVNTFGASKLVPKDNEQVSEIPPETIRAYIRDLLAVRKEAEKRESQNSGI